jgi:hypothetical protein
VLSTLEGTTVELGNECSETTVVRECRSDQVVSTCTSEELEGCALAQEVVSDRYYDYTPSAWRQDWVCEEVESEECVPSSTTVAELNADDFCSVIEEECTEELGSYCVEETLTYVCQEPSEPCVEEGDGETCQLVNAECVSESSSDSPYGCLTEEQTWQCSSKTEVCKEVGFVNTCDLTGTNGLQNGSQADHSAALADLATGMQIAKAIENNISGIPPKVFGGEEVYCTRTLIGSLIGNNCCSSNAEVGDGGFGECTAMDEKTAVARKADRAKFIASADHIRQYIDLAVGGFCSFTEKKREYYCAFDSLLARLIQEQGREQLKNIAEGQIPGGTTTLSFQYAEGTGSWTTRTVAGYTVRVKTHKAACDTLTSEGSADCPDSLQTLLEIFGNGEDIQRTLAVTERESLALSRTLMVMPGSFGSYCNFDVESQSFGKCEIRVKAWGASAGQITAPVSINASRYANASQWGPLVYGGDDWEFQLWQVGFNNTAIPDDQPVTLRWRHGIGATWQSVSLPSPLSPDDGRTINGAPVYGQCRSGECEYTVRIPLDGVIKPWVASYSERQHGCEQRYTLDCSGFSIAEFQMLDISKMDLSEFEASITDKVKDDLPDADDYQATALPQALEGADLANAGIRSEIPNDDPTASQYSAWLSEGEILTGQSITAFASIRWPSNEADDPVASARVKWGDGTSGLMTQTSDRFTATKRFNSAGEYEVVIVQRMADGTEHMKRLMVQVQDPDNPIPGLGGTPF